MKDVIAKLGSMRKPQEFSVYPHKEGDTTIIVQSDKSIGQFDIETGLGVLNSKGSNSKYFMHLHPQLGAVPFQFPADFVAECKAAQLHKGDHIGGGVFVG